MGIKKYYATADTTITNAFKDARFNDYSRATGSNMGLADSLEVFSIYGQSSGSTGYSQELSRILVKFPVTTSDDATNSIQAHRTAGTIPAKDKVKFYLRLYNVAHDKPVPRSATYSIYAVSSSWQEGRGIDMDEYKDITRDNEGANWIMANSSKAAASSVITVSSYSNLTAGDTLSVTTTDGTLVVATAHAATTTSTHTDTPTFKKETDAGTTAGHLATCLNANDRLTATADGAAVTITQAKEGLAGNTVPSITSGGSAGLTITSPFANGAGAWASPGGDYHTGSADSGGDALHRTIMYDTTLDLGIEDIEVDVTTLVEKWIEGLHPDGESTLNNYGFGIMLTSSQEAYFETSNGRNYTDISGGILHNTAGATTSYYTKKFSARDSEYFFSRPVLEARWDSAKKDDRANFYYSSSLATPDENLNTLYFYNYFRGQLRNIPGQDGGLGDPDGKIFVSLFSGTANNTGPEDGSPLKLVVDSPAGTSNVTVAADPTIITGGWVETGVYTASFAITGATSEPLATLFDVWFITSSTGQNHRDAIHLHTGTINPIKPSAMNIAPGTRKVNSIINLKDVYSVDEIARFRIFSRDKNWSPTIYTRANTDVEVNIVESGSYRIYRVVDDLSVIPYGTASSTLHTQMSFDASGNYFDLDMSMLEPGYAYAIKLAHYNGSVGTWVEQPETFKFRVEKWA